MIEGILCSDFSCHVNVLSMGFVQSSIYWFKYLLDKHNMIIDLLYCDKILIILSRFVKYCHVPSILPTIIYEL